jgi:hypothetical protein
LRPADFHTTSAFAAPPWRVRGLDYTFTIPHVEFRCCPSSLYTFPKVLRAWLGIAISGFPDFEQFCTASFPADTQACLSPLRLPFRHARRKLPHSSIIEQANWFYAF